MADRPNILLFMPDQLRADCVGAFGNPFVQTPSIDALAARGTRFTQAFAQNPVCSPSRVSMLTGWYPHVAGHRSLTHLIAPHEPNILRALKEAGYHVAWAGRRGDTFAKGVTELSTHRYGFAKKPEMLFAFAPSEREGKWARAYYHGLRTQARPVIDFDEATTRTAEQWLAEGLPEPWVLLVALIFPHPPFEVEEPWFSQHNRNQRHERVLAQGREPAFRKRIRERMQLYRLSEADWHEVNATYYGMIARVDAQLGRVLSAVDRAGAGARTVTFFFTDHGEYLGDYGLVEKWPSGVEECLLRNPLIAAGPGIAPGARCDALVEMLDLTPTLADLAQAKLQHTQFGRSLMPLFSNPDAAHKDAVFSEGGFSAAEKHLLEDAPFPYDAKTQIEHEDPVFAGRVAAIRTHEWTYVRRLLEAPELYHRASDPRETMDRAGEPGLAGIERQLNDRLALWMLETSDVMPWQQDSRF